MILSTTTSSMLRKGMASNLVLRVTSAAARHPTSLSPLLSAQCRNWSSSGNGDDAHDLFKQQMQELQEEREALFGPEDPAATVTTETLPPIETPLDLTQRSAPDQQDDDDQKAEREAAFGFTEEDRAGWSNAQNHKHSMSFMEQVNAARRKAEQNKESHSDPEMIDKNPKLQSTEGVPQHGLTHVSGDGTSVHMVNVAKKAVTDRVAVAESRVVFPPSVWNALTNRDNAQNPMELVGPKGPILTTAKIAGIMAAKKTSDLIPLCHPLPLNSVNVEIVLDAPTQTAIIQCECHVTHKTGVEMEALTGASVTALTLYDMCKALSHEIEIRCTCLIQKSGGKRNVNRKESTTSITR